MHPLIEKHRQSYHEVVEKAKKEFATLRTGRASPIIVENIMVSAYGVKTPIKQLASISVPEARTLIIQPWDIHIVKEIEKAIIEARIGLTPINEGKILRLTVPSLTSESRKELARNVHQKIENSRIQLRNIRDAIREEIMVAERGKEITEDDKYVSLKDLDEITKQFNDIIVQLGEKKENEIMTI